MEIKRQDKNNNLIIFRPNDKRYRYEVNGETKKGVTTLISARFGKDGLIGWAKKLPIEAIIWKLTDAGKSKDYIQSYVDDIKKKLAELEIKDATTGTLMHSYCEDYINGKKVVPPTTEPLISMYGKFTEWWDRQQLKVLATEQTCYSEELDVCGTFDAVVQNKKGKTILLDFKTSKKFYPDQPIQIATYKKLIEDSTNLKIDSYGIVKIPKEKFEGISFRLYEPKSIYLKGFKACKFLAKYEQDFLNREKEHNKLKKGKKNANK